LGVGVAEHFHLRLQSHSSISAFPSKRLHQPRHLRPPLHDFPVPAELQRAPEFFQAGQRLRSRRPFLAPPPPILRHEHRAARHLRQIDGLRVPAATPRKPTCTNFFFPTSPPPGASLKQAGRWWKSQLPDLAYRSGSPSFSDRRLGGQCLFAGTPSMSPRGCGVSPQAVLGSVSLRVCLRRSSQSDRGSINPRDTSRETKGSTRAFACSMSRPRGMEGSHHERARLT
jgi:hypothetical protein